MDVRVLGSCGSRVPGQQTSCLLVNADVVVDAGGITTRLSVDEQLAIDHVLISHAHLDHVYDLAFLAENVMVRRSTPLRVWAPRDVLDVLKAHLFNDELWPDLTCLIIDEYPVVQFCPLEEGTITRVGSITVLWRRTNHTVFSAGYLLTQDNASFLYTGDTSTTDEIWEMCASAENLGAIFVETSFPDRLEKLALATGHLTPSLLARELKKLDKPEVAVKIFHMKPQFLEEIGSDLETQGISCQILHGNEQFTFLSEALIAR